VVTYGYSGLQLSRSAQYHDVGLVGVQLQMMFTVYLQLTCVADRQTGGIVITIASSE